MNMARMFLTAVVVCASMTGFGCGNNDTTHPAPTTSSSNSDKKVSVFLLPKVKGVPYFETCAKGAEEAAKELGDVDLTYDGPVDGKADAAAKMIERWTLQGANVIAVSANDPAVLSGAMKSAREKGTHVITWDADTPADSRELFVNQASAQDIGYALVDTMAKDLGGTSASGEVAIVTATLTAANQNEWMKYMKERLANYPNLKLIATEPSDDNQSKALQITQDLMKAHPNLKGVWAISSAAFPGAAEAIKQAGKAGQVLVTGLSTPNDMKTYVLDGTVKSVVLWNTVDLGYLTVYAAEAVATGKYKVGDTTLKAGRLGDRKIVGDQVMLGDILVFTKDNISKYDF